MIFYVIKKENKYLQYSPFGFGYKWVDTIARATQFEDRKIAETCCSDGAKVFMVMVEEFDLNAN